MFRPTAASKRVDDAELGIDVDRGEVGNRNGGARPPPSDPRVNVPLDAVVAPDVCVAVHCRPLSTIRPLSMEMSPTSETAVAVRVFAVHDGHAASGRSGRRW